MIHITLIVTVSTLTWRLRSAFKLLICLCCPIICLYVLSFVLWLFVTISPHKSDVRFVFTSSCYLCHKWPLICSTCRKHFPVLSSFMTYHRLCNYINRMCATSGAGTAYPFWSTFEFTPGFHWDSCYSIFSFMCMICRSLFVLLSFFFYFDHCVVCSSSIYGFWLPPFGIFILFFL